MTAVLWLYVPAQTPALQVMPVPVAPLVVIAGLIAKVYVIGVYVAVIPVLPAGITAVQVAGAPAPPPELTQPLGVQVDESATVYPATEVADIESEVP